MNTETDSPSEGDKVRFLKDIFLRYVVDYYKLHVLLVLIAIVWTVFKCATVTPIYTAIAIVGPPTPSPTTGMLTNTGGFSASGAARRLLAGSLGAGGSNPYEEFLQLLQSSRLSQALVEKKHILQTIFYKRWDSEQKQWKTNALVSAIRDNMARLMNRPVSKGPGVDALSRYLEGHLTIERRKSILSTLMGDVTFIEISFQFDSKEKAEELLGIILKETDDLIRADQRSDVEARISFLKKELMQSNLAADERTALISILSDQEQLLAMISADKRYASTLVTAPYAPERPTWPRPLKMLLSSIVILIGMGCGMIYLSSRYESTWRWIRCFKVKGPTRLHRLIGRTS